MFTVDRERLENDYNYYDFHTRKAHSEPDRGYLRYSVDGFPWMYCIQIVQHDDGELTYIFVDERDAYASLNNTLEIKQGAYIVVMGRDCYRTNGGYSFN